MKRGDIYFAALDPTVGSEIKKTRPVLIVSNNINNKLHSLITVVPLTSQIQKVYRFDVLIAASESGLSKTSKAQCNQIRSISKQRFTSAKPAGKVSDTLLRSVEEAIRLHLNMD